jgi:short-subunit dehydrogenase
MKSIFITGGSQGIGYEVAKLFSSRGWLVGILDVNDELFERVSSELKNTYCYLGDVTDRESIESALAHFTAKNGGKLDVLDNNAGVTTVGEFMEKELDEHLKIVDVNLSGVITATYCAVPYLKKAGKSTIVNMCSASALYGNPEIPVYAATKSAVKSLTEGWSLIFRKYGIRVTDVLPIYVKTRMVTDYYEDFKKLSEKDVKLTPEQIAQKIWKAVHGKKIHYLIGADTKVYNQLLKFVPQGLIPGIVRTVLGYKE